MQKERRHSAILDLITKNRIDRQDHLAELLEQKGFSVTQSSISRDFEELGVVKLGGFYTLPRTLRNEMLFGLKSLAVAGENLVVAKCDSGLASACAVRIDAENFDEVVGTIAGDDTIFIAVRDSKDQKAVLKRIWELFGIGAWISEPGL